MLIRNLFAAAVGALAALSAVSQAHAQALSVEPLFVEITPGDNAAVRVRNTSDNPVTVELTVDRRSIDQAGVQTRTEAEDDFILFPPQAAIPGHGTQVFRMQPLPSGDAQSRSYFVTVAQLPVVLEDIPDGTAQVQMVFAFDVAVHVAPEGSRGQPELLQAGVSTMMVPENPERQPQTTAGDEVEQVEVPAVAIRLRNTGNKFLYLQAIDYVATGVDANGARVDLPRWTENQVIEAAGVTLVEPGAVREFKLPLPRNTPALRDVQVELRGRSQL